MRGIVNARLSSSTGFADTRGIVNSARNLSVG